MSHLYFLVALCVFASSEGEIIAPRIPPAFPRTQGSDVVPPTQDENFPASALPGHQNLPAARVYEIRPESRGSADWLIRRMAESESPDLRMRAMEAWPLSEDASRDLREIILRLSDPNPMVRASSRQRLRNTDAALVFSYVMRTMTGGSLDAVRELDAALPSMDDDLALYLVETLRTELETPLHKRIAAYCLGRMGAYDASDALAEFLWSDDADLARACLDAMAGLLSPGSTPHWLTLLDHPDYYFKATAVRALAALGNPKALETLRGILLGNAHPDVRQDALRAVSEYPPVTLFPLLIEIMEMNPALSASALAMLRRQSGMDLGRHPAPWREWWGQVTAPPSSPILPSP